MSGPNMHSTVYLNVGSSTTSLGGRTPGGCLSWFAI